MAGDDLTATVGQAVEFDGAASRPLIGIQTYSWDFGDGTTAASGAQVNHTFASVGRRTVTLTVTSGATTATDTMVVDVVAVPTEPGLRLTITSGGSPLAGADTAVISADGVRYRAVTNAGGVARIDHLPDGTYTAYAFKTGFRPGQVSATVTGGSGTASLALASGEIAQTDLTSRRLTYQEIVDAGIDPNDPQNQNVFEFEVNLVFGPDEVPLTLSGIATGGGIVGGSFGGGGSCGSLCASVDGYRVFPRVEYVGGEPTIVWMVIPGRAKWLKEFFEIQLLVTNLADQSFTFENGLASLGELPDGLSLAPTDEPQELVQSLPDIPGGATEGATWIVRGDTEGLYTLTADYSASLEPIGSAVLLDAATEPNALKVWGGSALQMTVDTDDRADIGVPYRLRIGLENVSDVPAYNPEVELLTSGRVNYIYQPKERFTQGTDVIEPGETFWTDDYRLVPAIAGTLDLSRSFVKKTAGNVDVQSTIVSHPATPLGSLPVANFSVQADGVHLDWAPVAGATGYEIFRTPNRDTDFPALPVATLSAGTTSVVIPNTVDGFFAVSSVVDGVNSMRHAMVGIPGTSGPPAVVPKITTTDLSLVEGDAGTRTGTVEVRLSEPTTVPVSVKVRSADVSATAPADYQAFATTTLVFAPGETVKTVTVTVNGDDLSEKVETFAVKVFDAIGGTVGDSAAKVTILEDDGPDHHLGRRRLGHRGQRRHHQPGRHDQPLVAPGCRPVGQGQVLHLTGHGHRRHGLHVGAADTGGVRAGGADQDRVRPRDRRRRRRVQRDGVGGPDRCGRGPTGRPHRQGHHRGGRRHHAHAAATHPVHRGRRRTGGRRRIGPGLADREAVRPVGHPGHGELRHRGGHRHRRTGLHAGPVHTADVRPRRTDQGDRGPGHR